MSSNGLASGNEHTEAVLHGLYEVIERDATTLWALEEPVRQQQRCIALETIDDADCQAVLQAFAAAGVSVGIWDMTTDVGLPAFACMIAEAERSTLRLLYPTHGMGCHAARCCDARWLMFDRASWLMGITGSGTLSARCLMATSGNALAS
jgi:ribosomal protein S12 methylthiotransferase accessory factor